MLTDSRVVYLFVYVSDLVVSRAFYKDTLGLRVIEEDDGGVKFDCGHVILALNRATDYDIPLPKGRDQSAEIVFLVNDVEAMRTALERRGVNFLPIDWDEPGGIINFYDPDGHWLTLYQPSEVAMMWPSGKRIRAVIDARQHRNGSVPQASSAPSGGESYADRGLDGSELIYLFLFVPDTAEAQVFYHDELGLEDLEGGPCNQRSSGDEVTKYDAGGVLLSIHHSEPTRELIEEYMRSVAPAFYVRNAEHVVQALSRRHTGFNPKIMRSGIGVVASLKDPSGRLLFLYEPSEEALRTPSGQKILEILATPF